MMARNFTSFTTLWDTLTPKTEQVKILNEERIRRNHCRGISICQTIFDDLLFCVILTGQKIATCIMCRLLFI